VNFSFSNTTGHDYTLTVADGVTQELAGLTTNTINGTISGSSGNVGYTGELVRNNASNHAMTAGLRLEV
jgi:hypothetical protein